VTILNLPETAKIIKRQKCPVAGFGVSNYTLRSGYSPLAEISVQCDNHDQAVIDGLVAQLEAARGVDYLELPYLSNGEHYLVQEYKVTPVLVGEIATLELNMVQQRSVLIPEATGLIRVPHIPLYESAQTNSFRNFAQQFNNGYQATKAIGQARTAERIWDVTFYLTHQEALLLDLQLVQRRGIYPFYWSLDGSSTGTDSWLCAEWQVEYFATDFYIFTGKFLYDGRSIESEAEICYGFDPNYQVALQGLPSSLGINNVFTVIEPNTRTFYPYQTDPGTGGGEPIQIYRNNIPLIGFADSSGYINYSENVLNPGDVIGYVTTGDGFDVYIGFTKWGIIPCFDPNGGGDT
jgi:phage-related protein